VVLDDVSEESSESGALVELDSDFTVAADVVLFMVDDSYVVV
jgi:hypothetical protein